MPEILAQERLIVALDLPHYDAAEAMVQGLSQTVRYFKVGMELFYASGRHATELVLRDKAKLFLDLKLHDIPNTVAKAMEQLTEIGAQMITVHVAGGEAMLVAAREAAERRAAALNVSRPLLLGVTVLTSIATDDLLQDGYDGSLAEMVRRRSLAAMKAGLDGIVCSPQEAALVKEVTGGKLFTVTPGVRPAVVGDDQKRVATPAEAIRGGSDYLVVGRPITAAINPLQAALSVQKEIEEALRS